MSKKNKYNLQFNQLNFGDKKKNLCYKIFKEEKKWSMYPIDQLYKNVSFYFGLSKAEGENYYIEDLHNM